MSLPQTTFVHRLGHLVQQARSLYPDQDLSELEAEYQALAALAKQRRYEITSQTRAQTLVAKRETEIYRFFRNQQELRPLIGRAAVAERFGLSRSTISTYLAQGGGEFFIRRWSATYRVLRTKTYDNSLFTTV